MTTAKGEPPTRVRWTNESPTAATLRPKRSWLYFFLFATVWNLVVSRIPELVRHPAAPLMDHAGNVFGTLFFLCALRELFRRAHFTFDQSTFVVKGGSFWPWIRFEMAVLEISGFQVATDPERGTTRVIVMTGAGRALDVPVPIEHLPIVMRGSKKVLLRAPPEHATFVAMRLGEMLEAARHLGHDTYRK
jgi:hypothetical protein